MTIQPILIGNYANDGTGDDLRTAFQKVNDNFSLLNTEVGVADALNVGVGTGFFKDKNTSTDNTVTITSTSDTVNLHASANLHDDASPTLGANLNLNGYAITGNGDVETTVYGIDIRIINNLLAILLENNSLNVDLGSIVNPVGNGINGYNFDFGSIDIPLANNWNFGTIV
jgi:hypothetical protein